MNGLRSSDRRRAAHEVDADGGRRRSSEPVHQLLDPLPGLKSTEESVYRSPFDARSRPNQFTDAEHSAGWRLFFDGSSFRGWRGLVLRQRAHSALEDRGRLIMKGPSHDVAKMPDGQPANGGDLMTTERNRHDGSREWSRARQRSRCRTRADESRRRDRDRWRARVEACEVRSSVRLASTFRRALKGWRRRPPTAATTFVRRAANSAGE